MGLRLTELPEYLRVAMSDWSNGGSTIQPSSMDAAVWVSGLVDLAKVLGKDVQVSWDNGQESASLIPRMRELWIDRYS